MSITYPGDEPVRPSQHNHGSGAFVGRDNYGTINTAIDETTKKILNRLSKEAPALAELLKRALQDGLVSPDTVFALEMAARNINEDTAYALRIAGENINEDVASWLRTAGENINENVVRRIEDSSTTIKDALDRLEVLSNTLEATIQPHSRGGLLGQLDNTVESIREHADRIEGITTPPPARTVVNWKPTFYAFLIGIPVGMLILAYIQNH